MGHWIWTSVGAPTLGTGAAAVRPRLIAVALAVAWLGACGGNDTTEETDTTTDTGAPTEDTGPDPTTTDTGTFPVSGDLVGTWEVFIQGKGYDVTFTWEAGPTAYECFLTSDFGDGYPRREACAYTDDGATVFFGDITCPYAGIYDYTVVPQTSATLTLVKDPTCPGREVVFANTWSWIGPYDPQ